MATVMLVFGILIIAPFLIGAAINELLVKKVDEEGEKNKSNAVLYMSGLLLLFSLFEVMAVVAIKLNFSLQMLSSLFVGMNCVLVMATLFIGRRKMPTVINSVKKSFGLTPVKFVLVLLVVLVMASLWVYEPFSYNHTTEETVLTTLFSGSLYECNPLTGMEMVNGMYPINQLYTTPLFEAVMIFASGADVVALMEYMYPAFVIFAHLIVVWLWARETKKSGFYMMIYALFLLFAENVDGLGVFALLHEGITGNVFAIQVIVPFAVYVLWKGKTLQGMWWRIVTLLSCAAAFIMNANLVDIKKLVVLENDMACMITLVILVLCLMYFLATGKQYAARKIVAAAVLFGIAAVLGLAFMVAAYVFSEIYANVNENGAKKRVVAGALLIIILGGSVYLYTDGTAKRREETITAEEEVLKFVEEYKKEAGLYTIVLAAPREIMQIVRKKTASVMLPFGRDYWIPQVNKEIGDIYDDEAYALYANLVDMKDLINKDTVLTPENEEHLLRVAALAKDKGCDVFVTTALMPESGYARLLKEIDGYFLYSVIK